MQINDQTMRYNENKIRKLRGESEVNGQIVKQTKTVVILPEDCPAWYKNIIAAEPVPDAFELFKFLRISEFGFNINMAWSGKTIMRNVPNSLTKRTLNSAMRYIQFRFQLTDDEVYQHNILVK